MEYKNRIADQFWDAIRFEVDHRNEDGQFMLTGSAVPADAKDIHHTGTGRYGWLTMRPMSLWESGDSTGEISLSDLFLMPDKIGALNKLTLPMLALLITKTLTMSEIFLVHSLQNQIKVLPLHSI